MSFDKFWNKLERGLGRPINGRVDIRASEFKRLLEHAYDDGALDQALIHVAAVMVKHGKGSDEAKEACDELMAGILNRITNEQNAEGN